MRLRQFSYIGSILIFLVGCSNATQQSRLDQKIQCKDLVANQYQDEVTENHTKTYQSFYSPSRDSCIAEKYEQLYQPGHEKYFMRLSLIDTVEDTTLIDYEIPDDPNSIFHISMEEYEGYKQSLLSNSKDAYEDYKNSLIEDKAY